MNREKPLIDTLHARHVPKANSKKMIYFLIMILILAIGSFFRINNLDSNPYGFFCDEASSGYNAFSLLKTGKDEYGKPWPILFQSFGDYKGPTLIYSTAISVKALGLNEFSTRIPSAIYGIGSIVLLFLIFYLRRQPILGLSSAFLLAISPWHIHFSRVAFENTAYLFFLLLGLVFWTLFIKSRKSIWIVLTSLAFLISFFSASSAKVIIPLLWTTLIIFDVKYLLTYKKKLLVVITCILLCSLPVVYFVQNDTLLSRYSQINQNKSISSLAKLYVDHYSWKYLFKMGDIDFPGQFITRHSIRGMGQLYLFQLPLLIVGLLSIRKYFSKKSSFLLILSFVLFPLPTLFSDAPSPHASRSLVGILPMIVISAAGLSSILIWIIKQKNAIKVLLLSIISIIITFSVLNFHLLLLNYPKYSSDYWGWQAGPRQIIQDFEKNQGQYQTLVMEGVYNGPDALIKFYTANKPSIQSHVILRDFDPSVLKTNELFAVSANTFSNSEQKELVKIVKTLYYPSGEPSFYLVAKK